MSRYILNDTCDRCLLFLLKQLKNKLKLHALAGVFRCQKEPRSSKNESTRRPGYPCRGTSRVSYTPFCSNEKRIPRQSILISTSRPATNRLLSRSSRRTHTLPSAPMRNVSRVKAFSSQRRVPQQTASSQDLAGVLIHSLLLQ